MKNLLLANVIISTIVLGFLELVLFSTLTKKRIDRMVSQKGETKAINYLISISILCCAIAFLIFTTYFLYFNY